MRIGPRFNVNCCNIITEDCRDLLWCDSLRYLGVYINQIFRISKINVYFQISEIVISDIQNNYSGYQKLCQKGVLFEISKKVILDIKNNNFGYPKINIYFGYQKLLFWISEIVIFDIWNSF